MSAAKHTKHGCTLGKCASPRFKHQIPVPIQSNGRKNCWAKPRLWWLLMIAPTNRKVAHHFQTLSSILLGTTGRKIVRALKIAKLSTSNHPNRLPSPTHTESPNLPQHSPFLRPQNAKNACATQCFQESSLSVS